MLNGRIRSERVDRGEVDNAQRVFGNDRLSIGTGDLIQTRRNESSLGVANRRTWAVQHVGGDGALSVVETLNGRKQQRTVTLPAKYVTEDVRLAYAVIAYGVQGATASASHTVLTDALDAAGVCGGMTRGRETKSLHVVATDLHDAKQQFVDALDRDRADRGLGDATERAREAVANLVADGPMSIVNAERDRVIAQIAQADAEREHWTSAAARLRDQLERHKAGYQPLRELSEAAGAKVAALLADVAESLAQEAATDSSEFLAACTAHRAKANTPRFRRRAATRSANEADTHRETVERIVHVRWQSIPHSESGLPTWAEAAAQRWAGQAPEIIEVREDSKVRLPRRSPQGSREDTRLYRVISSCTSPPVCRASFQRAMIASPAGVPCCGFGLIAGSPRHVGAQDVPSGSPRPS